MSSKGEFHAFLIGGTGSGCGKTTLTLGLLRLLARRGVAVAPFKCGPDYIDPLFHRRAAGCASFNLDVFFSGAEGVRRTFARRAAAATFAVVEGVMGLFDGEGDADADTGSAGIARLLRIPVILSVDARGVSDSIAPLVRGFATWHPEVRIAGVIANRVGSERHALLLEKALERHRLPPLLGALRRDSALELPERHLGLATDAAGEALLDRIADAVEQAVDLERLAGATRLPLPEVPPSRFLRQPVRRLRLGIARDEAFEFYYEENLELLRLAGIDLVEFSPLREHTLPPELDGLYLGGGFPELHAEQLSANLPMLEAVRAFARDNRPIHAECGGYLYLLQALTDAHGRRFPMAGILPGEAVLGDRLAALGYRELTLLRDGLFGPAGTRLRGHEFHYTRLTAPPVGAPFRESRDRDGRGFPAGSATGRVEGGYPHLAFASNPAAVEFFAEELAR